MPNGQTEHVRLRTVLFHNFALILFYPQARQGSLDRSKKIFEIFGKNDEVKTDRFRRRSEGSLKIEKFQNGVLKEFELETCTWTFYLR